MCYDRIKEKTQAVISILKRPTGSCPQDNADLPHAGLPLGWRGEAKSPTKNGALFIPYEL